MQKRWITDALMGLIFLLLFSYPFLPESLHEGLGIAVAAAVAVHLIWNRHWFTSFAHGRWNGARLASSLVTALLCLTLLLTLVSGILISQHLFRAVIPMALRQNMTIHQLHLWAPWALLILAGLHLGMHGKPIWMRLMRALSVNTRTTAYHIASTLLECVIILLGVLSSVMNAMGDRLLGAHVFATPSLLLGGPVFVASLLFLVGLYAIIGDKLMKLLR